MACTIATQFATSTILSGLSSKIPAVQHRDAKVSAGDIEIDIPAENQLEVVAECIRAKAIATNRNIGAKELFLGGGDK